MTKTLNYCLKFCVFFVKISRYCLSYINYIQYIDMAQELSRGYYRKFFSGTDLNSVFQR